VHATTGRAVVDFDHTSPEYAARAEEVTADLRDRCPVAFSEHHDGFWVITGYEPLAASMRDEATFSSRHLTADDGVRFGGVNIPEAPYENALVEMDPPEWNAFRRVLNPMFAPAAIERLQPDLERFTDAAVDARAASGTIDFVLDLANPVPAQVTLAFLGLELDDWPRFAEPAHEVVYTRPGTPEFERAVDGQQWMFETLAAAVADRRAAPRDDNLSRIVHADVDGRTFTEEEVVSLLGTIVNGGVDTTTALFANAIELLDRDHDLRDRLVGHPELIPTATEEFLRYFSPVQAFARTVARDFDLGGQHLRRGDRVLMCFASANRDGREFPEPGVFVAERQPNRHVAFGMGKHRCIGSTLARAEFATMLATTLRRLPDFAIDRTATVRYPSLGIVNGYVRMPATFTAEPTAPTGPTDPNRGPK
jgi:cytochrome P450